MVRKDQLQKGLDEERSDVSHTAVEKLNIVPLLMGCSYGQNLSNFLWLTIHTIAECKSVSQNSSNDYEDCWKALETSLKKGALTIYKLLCSFRQIDSLDDNIIHNPFFEMFLSIQSFLEEQVPSVEYTEDTGFNQQITDFAISLGVLLNSTCAPKHYVFNIWDIMAEYVSQNTIKVLYNFYVSRLNFYTGEIRLHLLRLGFRYKASTGILFITDPNKSD